MLCQDCQSYACVDVMNQGGRKTLRIGREMSPTVYGEKGLQLRGNESETVSISVGFLQLKLNIGEDRYLA